MEPVSAIGVAAAALQFAQFGGALLKSSMDVHRSVTGVPKDFETLEAMDERLSEYCDRLNTDCLISPDSQESTQSSAPPQLSQAASSLRSLCLDCERDCAQILKVVRQVRSRGRGKRELAPLKCVRVAIFSILKKGEVDALQRRIDGYQKLIGLHLATFTHETLKKLDAKVTAIHLGNIDLRDQRAEQFEKLRERQEDIVEGIRKLAETTAQAESPQLQSPADDIIKALQALGMNVSDFVAEQRVLNSIDYGERLAREEAISKAHEKTFHWFDDPTTSGSSREKIEQLHKWLSGRGGIFWISGRPGSGKSTLMKYIARHESTDNLLNTWSADTGVSITKACHYFWSPGTPMQRSHQGLLQSIVYDIFCQNPNLIQHVCSSRWNLAKEEMPPRQPAWTMSELQRTIESIRVYCSASESSEKLCICFFIDGLDEFSGDHRDLCQSLTELSKCPGIKLLLSSRSWPIFEDTIGSEAFGKLYVHDITETDIHDYAEAQLQAHPRWRLLRSLVVGAQAGGDVDIVEEITRRARGVFLWVYLVTRELKDGLTNMDDIWTLKLRLDSIPDDLDLFFRNMLDSVDSVYHDVMARWLMMTWATQEPQPVFVYAFNDMASQPDFESNFSIRDPWSPERPEPWTMIQWQEFMAPMARKVNARCKGLLEIHDGSIEFLHRTIRDFLSTAPMQEYLSKKLTVAFDPHLASIQSRLACLQHLDLSKLFDTVECHRLKTKSVSFSQTELSLIGWPDWEFPVAMSLIGAPWRTYLHAIFQSAEGVQAHNVAALYECVDSLHEMIENQAVFPSDSGSSIKQKETMLWFWREMFWHQIKYAAHIWEPGLKHPVISAWEQTPEIRWGHPFNAFLNTFTVTVAGKSLREEIHHEFPVTEEHFTFLRGLLQDDRLETCDFKLGHSEPPWESLISDAFKRPEVFKRLLRFDGITLFLDQGAKVDILVTGLLHTLNGQDRVMKLWKLFFLKLLMPHQIKGYSRTYMLNLDQILGMTEIGKWSVDGISDDMDQWLIENRMGRRKYPDWELLVMYFLRMLDGRRQTMESMREQVAGLRILIRHGRARSRDICGMDLAVVRRLIRRVFPKELSNDLLESLKGAKTRALFVRPSSG